MFSDLNTSSKSPYCCKEGGPLTTSILRGKPSQVPFTDSKAKHAYIHITMFCPPIVSFLSQLCNLLVTNYRPTTSHDLGVTALSGREQPRVGQSTTDGCTPLTILACGSLQILCWRHDYWDPHLKGRSILKATGLLLSLRGTFIFSILVHFEARILVYLD